MSALNISKYFLSHINIERFEDDNVGISNLKMEKLLFYAQKIHYCIFDTPLFDNEIQAWRHGPVVPEVYHHYKKYKKDVIDICEQENFIKSKEAISLDSSIVIEFVWNKLGVYEPWALVDMSHEEPEYKKNYVEKANHIIPLEDMKNKSALVEEFKEYKKALYDFGM